MKLFEDTGKQYDIVIPDSRFTGKSGCLDCQNTQYPTSDWQTQLGDTLNQMTMDKVAQDTLSLIQTFKQPNDTTIIYGLYSGSYLVHRMIQMNSTAVDAIIMDGVCAGKYCNGVDIDFYFDSMGKSILANACTGECRTNLGDGLVEKYSQFMYNVNNKIQACGNLVTFSKQYAAYAMFDHAYRSTVAASLYRIKRCMLRDTYAVQEMNRRAGMAAMPRYSSSSSLGVATHQLLSEFGSNASIVDNNLMFSTGASSTLASLSSSWKKYASSPYYNSIATFTGPMLMLNGDTDPYNPVSRAQQFAAHFSGPNQQLVILNNTSYQTVLNSPIANYSSNCAHLLVLQFIANPNSTVNASCTVMIAPISFDTNPYVMAALGGSAWDVTFTGDFIPEYYMPVIINALPLLIIIPFLILAFAFRKKQPVTSRMLSPYFGMTFAITQCVLSVFAFSYIGARILIPHLHIADIIGRLLLLTASWIYFVQSTRFLITRHMYKLMSSSETYNVKVYRFLTSKRTYYITSISFFVIWAAYGTITYPLTVYYGEDIYSVWDFVSLGCLVAICALLLAYLLYDMFVVDKLAIFKTGLRTHFITNDPLCFRLEGLLIIPTMGTGFIASIWFQFDTIYSQIPTAMNSLFCVFMFGGVAICSVLVNLQRNNVKEENSSEPAHRKLLADPLGKEIFAKYAIKELSYENFAAWEYMVSNIGEDETSFKTIEDEEKKKLMDDFFEQFVNANSKMELNIPDKVRSSFHDTRRGTNDGVEMWKGMRLSLEQNLVDTFMRLKHTPEYRRYSDLQQERKEMLERSNLKI